MSFKTIWDNLETKLGELNPTYIWTIYNYDPKVDENMSTPCIIISPANWREERLDTAQNESYTPFYVRVLDQYTDDKADVEDNIRDLADRVMEKIKDMTNPSFSNWAVHKIEFDFTWWYTEWQEPFRVFELLVKFYSLEDK